MVKDKHKKNRMGQIVLCLIIGLLAISCFLPVLLVVVVSFTSEESVASIGFSFFPISWSLEGYKYVLDFIEQVGRAYLVTIYETIFGTLWTILLCAMFGYTLSRRSFRLRNFLSVFLLVTMIFNGGTMVNYLVKAGIYGLRNNLLVLIVPGVSAYTCIVMRTFIQTNVPDSLIESAKIDGAGEFYIFFKIVMPLVVPALAALGFMQAVGHWNEWQTAYLYIDDSRLSTLQLVLIRIEKNMDYLKQNMGTLNAEEMAELINMPDISTRMAILIVTLGPILIAYPFFQKYFIKGMTVGAVKG